MVLRVLRVSLSSVLAVRVSTAIESSWPRAANTSTTSLKYYPVVIITCVHYLGPPGPSTSQILGTFPRFSEDFLGRERDPRGLGKSERVLLLDGLRCWRRSIGGRQHHVNPVGHRGAPTSC